MFVVFNDFEYKTNSIEQKNVGGPGGGSPPAKPVKGVWGGEAPPAKIRGVWGAAPPSQKYFGKNPKMKKSENECNWAAKASGGGKSSILALLQRWYDPSSGAILVDGIPSRQP